VSAPKTILVDRRGAVRDDRWIALTESEAAPREGDIIVPLARLDEIAGEPRPGRLGVHVAPADKVEALAPYLDRLALVAVAFPAFRDGRGFSSARLLRDRLGFKGELRAVGEVLEDQIFFLIRCGFDSFEIVTPDAEAAVLRAARSFSFAYQAASDRRRPVHRLRMAPGAGE
jgi:uncharacterized protein (DUF934 family)